MIKNSILVNIDFNNEAIKNKLITELYLFYRLRVFASNNGGFINKFQFTKNEKYNILPKLVKLGWISEDKKNISKYRELTKNNKNYIVRLDTTNLCDLKSFKVYLLTSIESYSLHIKDAISGGKISVEDDSDLLKVDWEDRVFGVTNKVRKIKSKEDSKLSGRVFRKDITNISGLQSSTIDRWRKTAKKNNCNTYNTTYISSKKMNTNDQYVRNYINKNKLKVYCDLVITTSCLVTNQKIGKIKK